MEISSDQAPAVGTRRLWGRVRVAVVVLGAVAFAWNAWWIAHVVAGSNMLDSSKPLGIPLPIGGLLVAGFGAFLGMLGGLTALVSRPDGSRLVGVILVGAAVLAVLGLVVGQPWNVWTPTSFTSWL